MSVFKDEMETKRVIFNVQLDLARRLEVAKEEARKLGKKLDADSAVDKALEKFLRKAERKIEEMKEKNKGKPAIAAAWQDAEEPDDACDSDDADGELGKAGQI